jgi:L-aspartate oxidase
LDEARGNLEEWSFILDKTFRTRRELELKNMLEVSKVMTESALLRKGSVGAHYRSDYPGKDQGWERHIVFKEDTNRLTHEFIL